MLYLYKINEIIMSDLIIDNKPFIIESATYRGTVYTGRPLDELINSRLRPHLDNIASDINPHNPTFTITVYHDHVESNGYDIITHPFDYEQIVEKTKNFVASSPQSLLPSTNTSSDELASLKEFYTRESTAIQDRLSFLQKDLADMQGRLAANGAVKRAFAEQTQQSEALVQRLQEELRLLKNQNAGLEFDIGFANHKLKAANNKLDQIQADMSELTKANQSLQTEMQKMTHDRHSDLDRLQEELSHARQEQDAAQNSVQEQQAKLRDLTHTIESNERELTQASSVLSQSQDKIQTLENENQLLNKKAQNQVDTISNLEDRLAQEATNRSKTQESQSQEINRLKAENKELAEHLNKANANKENNAQKIQALKDQITANNKLIDEWAIALKTQEATIAQLNTKKNTLQEDIAKLEKKAVKKEQTIQSNLKNLEEKDRLIQELRNELAMLRSTSEAKEQELRETIIQLEAEIKRLNALLQEKEKPSNAVVGTINNMQGQTLKLSSEESKHFHANMRFLEHPIQKIEGSQVTLNDESTVNQYSRNQFEQKIAATVISEYKKKHKTVKTLPNLNSIDQFVGSLVRGNISTKKLLVKSGNIVPRLMAFEFLSRDKEDKTLQAYNESINEVRQAIIKLRDRTTITN